MNASKLIELLQNTIRHHGDFQVEVDVEDAGWHRLKAASSVSVEEVEGNYYTIINHE
jgi:hypothetical protein